MACHFAGGINSQVKEMKQVQRLTAVDLSLGSISIEVVLIASMKEFPSLRYNLTFVFHNPPTETNEY